MPVLCTVICVIKPERADEFVETLDGMFPETKTHAGFIGIRLLKSDSAPNEFILLEEWESPQHHQAYSASRSDRGDLDRLMAMMASPVQMHYWDMAPLASA